MGGHPLALIQSASTLCLLHVLPCHSILGGMASTLTNARSMSVLPWLQVGGTSPLIIGGSFVPPPPKNFGYYHHGHGGPPAHHGGHPSVQLSLSVHGGHQAPPQDVPSFVYNGAPFPQGHGGYPCATTSVAPSLAFVGLLHHPSLPQDDHHSSSGSDITMSFPGPGQDLPPPLLYHPRPPPAPSGPAAPPSSTAKALKLNSIKDSKAYLDALGIILFYLRDSNFSGLADGALVTSSSNFEASSLWEGQLCLAVKDGKLQFLFGNKGDICNGRRFKILAALNAYCHPNSVANTFSSLLLIFNKLQGKNKRILAFRSCFDGLIFEMAHCKVVIPPLLLIMLFLWALHSCYSDIADQFRTWHQSIKMTSIELIFADVTYHDKFILKEPCRHNKSSEPHLGFLRRLRLTLRTLVLFGVLLSIG
jgi:hypothetical protein